MQRHRAATLHLLAIEPHRHALSAGIALSGLLHAAALWLRPPVPIEAISQEPPRASAFVVDVIHRDVAAVLEAPSPAPLVPRAPAPRIAPTPPKAVSPAASSARAPRDPAPTEPSPSVPSAAPPALAEAAPLPPSVPSPSVPSPSVLLPSEPAVSTVPALVTSAASAPGTTPAAPGATGMGVAGVGSTGVDSRSPPASLVGSLRDDGAARASVARRARYVSTLLTRIRQHRQYPYFARRRGIEGTVCVQLGLGAGGQLTSLRVTCGGDSAALVEAARAAVTEAAPFEPLPTELGTSLAVEVPIVFRLEEG